MGHKGYKEYADGRNGMMSFRAHVSQRKIQHTDTSAMNLKAKACNEWLPEKS